MANKVKSVKLSELEYLERLAVLAQAKEWLAEGAELTGIQYTARTFGGRKLPPVNISISEILKGLQRYAEAVNQIDLDDCRVKC